MSIRDLITRSISRLNVANELNNPNGITFYTKSPICETNAVYNLNFGSNPT